MKTSLGTAALYAVELLGAAIIVRLGWELGGRLWVWLH